MQCKSCYYTYIISLLSTVTEFKFTVDAFRLFKSNAFRDVEERLQALTKLPQWQASYVSAI